MGTPCQKKILFLVFASSVIPAAVVAICMYYLIFNTLALQMVIPEAIAYNLMPVVRKVNTVMAIVVPISLLAIWLLALELSNRIAGPICRIQGELDKIISGEIQAPIEVRENDELKPLVDKINKLMSRQIQGKG